VDIGPAPVKATVYRYSYDNAKSDFYASRIRTEPGGYFVFDLNYPGGTVEDCKMGVPGRLNAENGIAAAAAALLNGISPEKVKEALGTFMGVKRRLDMHLNTAKTAYIDDYAHHPKEIEAAIRSIRDIFPGRKLTAVFQPHLYTRTRDFAEGFAEALSLADRIILLDIYPARELPIEGVTSKIIFDRIKTGEKKLITRTELMSCLENEDIDVLVTFGAGDIDRFTESITEMLEKRSGKC
jgi:UDP-N-acetylmuramate--alanine ligase